MRGGASGAVRRWRADMKRDAMDGVRRESGTGVDTEEDEAALGFEHTLVSVRDV